MDDAVFVMPNVTGRRSVELANKRQRGVGAWTRETQNLKLRCRQSKALSRGHLAPGSGGHCVLMWRCGDLDSWPDLLSNRSGHKPPHHISHHDAPDAARRFLQRSDASYPHNSEDFLGDVCLRKSLAEKPKLVAICFRIQKRTQVFCSSPGRATCCSTSSALQILHKQALIQLERNLWLCSLQIF